MPSPPLADLVRDTAVALLDGRMTAADLDVLAPNAGLHRPRRPEHGDLATGLALRVAARLDVPARDLADRLAAALGAHEWIVWARPAGPGFVNLALHPSALPCADAATPDAATPDPVDPAAADPAVAAPAGVEVVAATGPPTGPRPVRPSDADHVVTTAGRVPWDVAVARWGADSLALAAARAGPGRAVDMTTALSRTAANPLFRLQHAHARLRTLLRAADAGDAATGARGVVETAEAGSAPQAELLVRPEERDLVAILAAGLAPRGPAGTADGRVTARVLDGLADAVHRFCDAHRVLPVGDADADPAQRARVGLAAAAQTALAHGMGRLGITAAERV